MGSVLTARGGPLPARTCRAGTRLRRFLPFCFSFCFCFLPLFEFSLFRLRYQLTKNRIPDIGMNEVFYDWFFLKKISNRLTILFLLVTFCITSCAIISISLLYYYHFYNNFMLVSKLLSIFLNQNKILGG